MDQSSNSILSTSGTMFTRMVRAVQRSESFNASKEAESLHDFCHPGNCY